MQEWFIANYARGRLNAQKVFCLRCKTWNKYDFWLKAGSTPSSKLVAKTAVAGQRGGPNRRSGIERIARFAADSKQTVLGLMFVAETGRVVPEINARPDNGRMPR